jgi:hypothetical protein
MQRKSTGQIRSTRARRRSPPADHENFQSRGGEQPAIQPINQLKDSDSRWSALQGLGCGEGGGGNCRWEYFTARHCYLRAEGHASGGSLTIQTYIATASRHRDETLQVLLDTLPSCLLRLVTPRTFRTFRTYAATTCRAIACV